MAKHQECHLDLSEDRSDSIVALGFPFAEEILMKRLETHCSGF